MTSELPQALTDYLATTRVALAIASAAADNPLLMVNDPFRALTGYGAEDIVGRNCRLLQRDADTAEARERIREFLANDRQPNVRTPIVNFRRDGTPFVNLLYMSRLRARDGQTRFLFASQFDVSRSQPELLADYDRALAETLGRLTPLATEAGIVVEGTLMTIANSAATVAQAKMTLAELEVAPHA